MQIYSWTALGLTRVGIRVRGIRIEGGTFPPHVFKLDVYADSGWAGAADRHSHSNMFTECEHGLSPVRHAHRKSSPQASVRPSSAAWHLESPKDFRLIVVMEIFNYQCSDERLLWLTCSKGTCKTIWCGEIEQLDMRVLPRGNSFGEWSNSTQ